jgi:predicted RNase H-like nuclease
VRILGVDLAWAEGGEENETGVVAAEPDGTIVDAGWTTGVAATLEWANRHATDRAVMFVDAPLTSILGRGSRAGVWERVARFRPVLWGFGDRHRAGSQRNYLN